MDLHNQRVIKKEGTPGYNTAQALMVGHKGLSGMDESISTCSERFRKIRIFGLEVEPGQNTERALSVEEK